MADDTQSVEAPETAMSRVSETRRIYLAYIIWLSFMAFIAMVSLHPVQLPGDTLGIIIGGLLTLIGGVTNYYFSTSMGSSTKSLIMGRSQQVTTVTTEQPKTTTTTVGAPTPTPAPVTEPVKP
jgi:hypothetical protein